MVCGGFACGRSNARRVLMACLALFGPYLLTRLALPCSAVDQSDCCLFIVAGTEFTFCFQPSRHRACRATYLNGRAVPLSYRATFLIPHTIRVSKAYPSIG
jgi:hypothetical protein